MLPSIYYNLIYLRNTLCYPSSLQKLNFSPYIHRINFSKILFLIRVYFAPGSTPQNELDLPFLSYKRHPPTSSNVCAYPQVLESFFDIAKFALDLIFCTKSVCCFVEITTHTCTVKFVCLSDQTELVYNIRSCIRLSNFMLLFATPLYFLKYQ